ncbi:MAG: PAS domain S-box protein [Vulcanimicrobiota bacterium]
MNAAARRKILIVEDDMIIAMDQSEILSRSGYQVITACSGEKAIDMIKADPSIDLVLMDIDLGRGIEGTEAAKQILALRNLPVVFLTSHSERKMVEKVRGITRYGYVLKDSGDFVLQSSLEMAFELFDAHRRTRDSEEQFRSLFENSTSGVAIHDIIVDEQGMPVDFLFVQANQAFDKHTGMSIKNILGKCVTEVLPGIQKTPLIAIYGKVAHTGESIKFEQFVEPLKRHLNISAYKVGKNRVAAVIENITEYKRVEAVLKRKRVLLQQAEHIAKIGSWEWNIENNRLIFSNGWLRNFGQQESELPGMENFLPLMHPDDRAAVQATVQHALEGTKPYDIEHRIIRQADGAVRHVHARGEVIRNVKGQPVRMFGIAQDITRRKNTEEALRESEARFRNITPFPKD